MSLSFSQIINNFLTGIISPSVALLIGIALVLFLWGLINYLKAGLGDKAAVDKAKTMMTWGIIMLTVMVSVWGLVQVLQEMFFGSSVPNGPPTVPCFSGDNCPTRGEFSPPDISDPDLWAPPEQN